MKCIRCGQPIRDLVEAVTGLPMLEPGCLDAAVCKFRAYGSILTNPDTKVMLHRRGEVAMRLGGRLYDRYTEPAR